MTTDRAGAPRGEVLSWGLVPHWAKDPVSPVKMINARAETLEEKPAYRDAFGRFRCLILADGFYEWSTPAGLPGRSRKQAFHITRLDGQPFAFAGLWSIWRGGESGASVLHDHHHGRQLGRRPSARPDARDP